MPIKECPLMPPACTASTHFFAPDCLFFVSFGIEGGMRVEVVERSRGVWPQPSLSGPCHVVSGRALVAPAFGPAPFWCAGGFHKSVAHDSRHHSPRTAYRSLHARMCGLAAAVFLRGLYCLHVV